MVIKKPFEINASQKVHIPSIPIASYLQIYVF